MNTQDDLPDVVFLFTGRPCAMNIGQCHANYFVGMPFCLGCKRGRARAMATADYEIKPEKGVWLNGSLKNEKEAA